MRYFRHGPLAVYSVAALALVVVLALAVSRGHHLTTRPPYGARQDLTTVVALNTRAVELPRLLDGPVGPLEAWAADTGRLAASAASARAASFGRTDPVAAAYHRLALDARALAVKGSVVDADRVQGDLLALESLVVTHG